jgi:NadR type nicotinamide-nucleotide adenylyltransferase
MSAAENRSRALRVAILGAESTGKSTLAATLAAVYGTLWVPEYLREFVEMQERTPLEHEQYAIACTQVAQEEAAAAVANRYLFCDTTPLMTAIYSRFYWGKTPAELAALAACRRYDFTFVTAPDGGWVADGLQRESEAVQQTIHAQLLASLASLSITYTVLEGGVEQRVSQVRALLP